MSISVQNSQPDGDEDEEQQPFKALVTYISQTDTNKVLSDKKLLDLSITWDKDQLAEYFCENFKNIRNVPSIFSKAANNIIKPDICYHYSDHGGLVQPIPHEINKPILLKYFFKSIGSTELPEIILQKKRDEHQPEDPESHRKTAAEGLLDTGFLIAQANLLKEIVNKGAEHYTVLLTLLIISIVLQAVVAILLGIIGTWQKPTQQTAHWLHNVVIIIVSIILMINIIITAFHS